MKEAHNAHPGEGSSKRGKGRTEDLLNQGSRNLAPDEDTLQALRLSGVLKANMIGHMERNDY